MAPLPGEREFEVSISYFEDGKLRGFEIPVWTPTHAGAVMHAEKVMRQRHPNARVYRCLVHDVEYAKIARPRLVQKN